MVAPVSAPTSRQPTIFITRFVRHAADRVAPLWLAGTVACLLTGAQLLFPDPSYRELWLEYAAIAVLVLVVTVGVLLLERRGGERRLAPWKPPLGLGGVALGARALLLGSSPLLWLLAIGLLVIAALSAPGLLGKTWPRLSDRPAWLAALAVALMVVLLVSSAATRLIWWAPWTSFVTSSGWNTAVLVLAVVIVTACVNASRHPPRSSTWREWMLTGAGAVTLFVVAFQDSGLFDYTSFHHWGYYTGPAELVKQGHWLLWDVPSQYGFLSTLALALVPVRSPWQALFLLNGLLNAISAIVVFLVLRSLGRGALNLLFAVAIAMSAQFLRYLPQPSGFPGPTVFPSTGGLRFAWLLVLMALLLPLARSSGRRRLGWYSLTCGVWLGGVLWSWESAVYCTAVWLPVCSLCCLRRAMRGEDGDDQQRRLVRRWGAGALWLVGPIGGLAAAITAICGFYLIRLGQLPDWRNFTEFVAAFQEGYQRTRLASGGAVWVLIVVFCTLSTAAYHSARRGGAPSGVEWGAWSGFTVTASYFVGRSDESIVQVLSPVFVLALAMMLVGIRRRGLGSQVPFLIRASTAPVLIMLVTSGLGHRHELADYGRGLGREVLRVSTLLPRMDPRAQALLTSAGVGARDPISSVECYPYPARMPAWVASHGEVVVDPTSWLPADPYGELLPLTKERLRVYLERFSQRAPGAGWLLQCKGTPAPVTSMMGWIDDNYRVVRMLENSEWRLTLYRSNRSPGSAGAAAVAGLKLP